MRTLAILAVAGLLLAGCSGKSALPTTTTAASKTVATSGTSTTAAGTSTGTSTSVAPSATTNAHENQAPKIETFSASRANATTLAFSFVAAGSDPDGDTLNWTLDGNGDGKNDMNGAMPVNVTYIFAVAGNYTATLTITDGHLSANRTLAINATLAAGGPLTSIALKWTVGTAWCIGYPYNPASGLGPIGATPFKHGLPTANVAYAEAAVAANLVGHSYTADFGAPFGAGGQSEDAIIIAFYDAADNYLDSAASQGGLSTIPPSAPANPMVVVGVIPADAAIAVAGNCANPGGASATMVVS